MQIKKSVYLPDWIWDEMAERGGRLQMTSTEYLRYKLTKMWGTDREEDDGPRSKPCRHEAA